MADVTITPRANGPYMIQGNFEVVDAQGNKYSIDDEFIALCRCGHSENKPFCDGAHRPAGFEADSEAR